MDELCSPGFSWAMKDWGWGTDIPPLLPPARILSNIVLGFSRETEPIGCMCARVHAHACVCVCVLGKRGG